jgi:hypothetical protein
MGKCTKYFILKHKKFILKCFFLPIKTGIFVNSENLQGKDNNSKFFILARKYPYL